MRQKPGTARPTAESLVKEIRRRKRKHHSAEEMIRIVLDGLCGEGSIAELCRRKGVATSLYYIWSLVFLGAGKKRLAGNTARQATSPEVKELRHEASALKEAVADLTLENRLPISHRPCCADAATAKRVEWSSKEKRLAAAGVASLAVGAYFTVFATEKIVGALGLAKIIGGLFITAPVAALPEVPATWYIARSGQITSGVTSVIGDHAVTMTLAFIPLTIVGMTIDDFQLFWVTLSFVALMPALYAAFIWWGRKGFRLWQVLALPVVYAVYLVLLVVWVQPFGKGG